MNTLHTLYYSIILFIASMQNGGIMGEDGEANLLNLCQPKEVFKDRWEVV